MVWGSVFLETKDQGEHGGFLPPGATGANHEGTYITCGEGCEESNVALGEGLVVGPTEVQHQGHPDDGDIVPAEREIRAQGFDRIQHPQRHTS